MQFQYTNRISGLICTLFLLPLAVLSQTPFWGNVETELRFKHLTTEQGLSSNVTSVILKDSRGFMWFGTDAGLNRYDGFQIKTYNYQQNASNNLSNDVIKALYEDKKGRIWIGTEKGLNLYDPEDESIRFFLGDDSRPGSLSNNSISAITEDDAGNLWIGSFFGLNKLSHWENNEPYFEQFYNDSKDTNSISNNRIFSLLCDSKGNLWVGTERGGLNLLRADAIQNEIFFFEHIKFEGNREIDFEEAVIYSICQDHQGNILTGTNQGFSILSPDNTSFRLKHFAANKNRRNWLNEENVYSITTDEKGQIWLATFGGGLYLYDAEKESFTAYKHDIFNNESLSRNHLYSVRSTPDGLLWVAARETGIDQVNPGMQTFTHLKHIPNRSNGLSNNVIKAISEGPDGKFWFGTYGGGLNSYDPQNGKFDVFTNRPEDPNSLCSDIVESVCFDHKGRVWAGTSKGLNLYDPKTRSLKCFVHDPDDPESISDANIWFVLPARDKSGIWVGTYDGLDKYDWNEDRFYHFKNDPRDANSLSFNFIRALYEDEDNNLWICTWGGGLNKLNVRENRMGEDPTFIHYKNKTNENTSISNDLVNCIYEDSKGRLWLGTQAGLNLMDKSTGTFTSYFKTDGLADNVIKGILEDKTGNIWISTQNGLSKFDPETGKFRNYFKKDGLQGNIFNMSSCWRNSRDELMFGGNSGISIFDPEEITENTTFPKVYFTGLKINNRDVLPGDSLDRRVLYQQSLDHNPGITLKYDENLVNFDFTAIEYVYPEKITFAYKLDGADKDWNYTPYNNRKVSYPGLKRGKYRFRVKASNVNGEWGDNEVFVEFRVKPHLARTYVAYLLYFAIVLSVVLFIRNQTLNRLKMRQELKREREAHKRRIELNQFKLQFFTNISHEFRTPITLISAPLQKLITSGDKLPHEQKQSYLETINRSVSVLGRLVDQLMDFRKAENKKMKLKVSYTDIGRQLGDICKNFRDFADQKNLQFVFESDHNSIHYWYDTDKLEKIVYNLLSNAFKFTPVGGKIGVALKNQGEIALPEHLSDKNKDDYFCVVVSDTGIGISDANKKYIFDRFSQIDSGNMKVSGTGIGLSFTRGMVDLHRGFIDLESEVGKGSCFYVWLPAREDMFSEEEMIKDNAERKTYTNGEFTPPLLPDTADSGEDNKASKSKSISILIVEDYTDLRNFLADLFSKNYNVLQASNGREGLEKVHTHGPDIIVTDVMMPEMDGLEFTRSVKKNMSSSHIPVIMLTAKNTSDSEIQGLETGADYYVSKPFNVEQLQLVVHNIIEGRKKVHQKFAGVKIPEPKEIEVVSVDEKFIIKVSEVIEKNIAEPEFSVEFLASESGLSTVHLYRKLKALTGMTPNEFIRSFRMKRASQLLETKKMMVSEVAYAVGFNDPKYFRKCFKKTFGVSPSEYMEKV